MRRIAAVFLMVLVSCAGQTADITLDDAEVQLSIFSGLPDPRWKLTQTETTELQGKLSDLRRSEEAPPETGLGYRGFVVRTGGLWVEVRSGFIVVTEGETRTVYTDRHHAEKLLVAQAARHGYGGLIPTGQ